MSVHNCLALAMVLMSVSPVVRDRSLLRVVAEVGGHEIRYGDIACDRMAMARHAPLRQGRSIDDACTDTERTRFKSAVIAELKEQACAMEHCALEESDIAAFRDPKWENETWARQFAEASKRRIRAEVRVLRGESADAVYADVGQTLGVSLEKFRFNIESYEATWENALEVVEGWLQKDWEAAFRDSNTRAARGKAMNAFLRARIEAIAKANKLSIEAAEDTYLADLLKTIKVKILDDRFSLPTGKEVFP